MDAPIGEIVYAIVHKHVVDCAPQFINNDFIARRKKNIFPIYLKNA